jgi:hypothetical protein
MGRALLKAMRSIKDDINTFNLPSYKKKPLLKRIWDTIYLSDFVDPIHKAHTHFYRVPLERIKRIYAYSKAVWGIGEFDYNWHLRLWAFSLKRLRGCMVNGSSVLPKSRLRKLNTAIALLERMTDTWENYHEPASKAFDAKWGKREGRLFKEVTDEKTGRTYTTLADDRRDALTPELQKQYDKDKKVLYNVEDKMFNQDMALFTKILSKQVRSWWD